MKKMKKKKKTFLDLNLNSTKKKEKKSLLGASGDAISDLIKFNVHHFGAQNMLLTKERIKKTL